MTKIPTGQILVTGARGMLAGHLIPHLEAAGHHFILSDRIEGAALDRQTLPISLDYQVRHLDVTDIGEVRATVDELRPSWIVNCSAYTAVDAAETEAAPAIAINGLGPKHLAECAREFGARLLHVSSDYVFGRLEDRTSPIAEDTPAAPCGVYGFTKHLGDEFVRCIHPGLSLIVRPSWLHGLYGPNFVDTILRAAKERDELAVVNDQTGSPTWAEWLAEVMVKLMKLETTGVVHATSRGDITWYEFAKEIVSLAGLKTRVKPQSSRELNRPAPRPPYSTLALERLEGILGEPAPDWREGLKAHLRLRGYEVA